MLGVKELGLAEIRIHFHWRQCHHLAPGVRSANRRPGCRAGAGGGKGGPERVAGQRAGSAW